MKYEIEQIKDFLIIHIVGDMTRKEHLDILDRSITERIDQGFHKFVFNLEKVENIDLDGIDLFINCLTDVTEHGGGCYALCEDESVYKLLERVGLGGLLTIYRSDEEFSSDHGISAFE